MVIFHSYVNVCLPEGNDLMAGWRRTYPSEKYEFVNGKDDIPYIMEK